MCNNCTIEICWETFHLYQTNRSKEWTQIWCVHGLRTSLHELNLNSVSYSCVVQKLTMQVQVWDTLIVQSPLLSDRADKQLNYKHSSWLKAQHIQHILLSKDESHPFWWTIQLNYGLMEDSRERWTTATTYNTTEHCHNGSQICIQIPQTVIN